MARKILLADDSVTAQNMGRKILADAGYEVTAVNNGSAALKKIVELRPDLVILDVYMPGYSGLEVCQRLKESHETSRIPVLLTVGKLEPFKPEEAQRVRAEGYIVKPFEASELLSALSKLEDKVVPRSEPSKPGRFARAMAAAEESGNGRNGENGWKSRISFPHEKTESEKEKVEDDSAIYNPVNRDLRTVIETAEEKASNKVSASAAATEASVDVAALAPAGLPRDVTPEEVAAITAAAAQIKIADEALKEQKIVPEDFVVESAASTVAEQSAEWAGSVAATVAPAQEIQAAIPEPTVAEERQSPPSEQAPQETNDVPVTMAAASESVTPSSAPRWTAVPVALEGQDATISLDQEMQKAHSAVAESAAAVQVEPVSEKVTASAASPAISEVADTAISHPSVAPEVPVPALTVSDAVAKIPEPVPVEASPENFVPETIAAEPVPSPAQVAEFMSPVSAAEVAGLAGIVGLSAELQQPSSPPASPIASGHQPESDTVSDTVKDTAAAWANWREGRDTSKSDAAEQSQPAVSEAPEAVPAENARAVAAGAEHLVQEAPAAPEDNPSDVASIVDSVLADLRPKLMAEISRKMAEKK